MPLGFARIVVIPLLVLASPWLVHWAVAVSDAVAADPLARTGTITSGIDKNQTPTNALPLSVAQMHDAILAAVDSGQIEELRSVLDWNELKPEVSDTPVADAVAYWRQISADGEGREILTILADILRQPYEILPVGPDAENNRLYV